MGEERRRHQRSDRGQLHHAGNDQHGQRIAIRGDRLELGGKRNERSRDSDGNVHTRHLEPEFLESELRQRQRRQQQSSFNDPDQYRRFQRYGFKRQHLGRGLQ